MNLALNARDAMIAGGQLTLETANIEFDDRHHCRFDTIPEGRYVRLMLRDNGSGMDEKTLSHIFEPFYTTKGPGQGTGLGLPVVFGIVRQNGGCIDVESQPGQGTTFIIYLPRSEAAEDLASELLPLKEKLEGSETILIVEDELALRTLLNRFFRLYGYKILEARDGNEALEICQKYEGPIHLC
jgi:nitrogen fixation/metabolism regulation signal transduction histidine kinase